MEMISHSDVSRSSLSWHCVESSEEQVIKESVVGDNEPNSRLGSDYLPEAKVLRKHDPNWVPMSTANLSSPTFHTAKTQIPELRRGFISRARLNRELDAMPDYKFTLLIAPAGYGKTTAIVDWTKTSGWPMAWLSLDHEDNCLLTFWRYIHT
jgi:hypothetical protein